MMSGRRNQALHPMLRSEVGRAFDDVFGDFFGDRTWRLPRSSWRRSFPAVNVWEDEANLYVEAEVPGLRMDDLEIYVKGTELTIRGQRAEQEREGVTFHRRERGTGAFSGRVQLPVEVEVEAVQARLESGVLTVTLPKAASAKPRRIEVKVLKS